MYSFFNEVRLFVRALAKRHPGAKKLLSSAQMHMGLAQHTVGRVVPQASARPKTDSCGYGTLQSPLCWLPLWP